jgi:anti-anti-sigma regulatory factor
MNNIVVENNYFQTKELSSDIILLSLKIPYIRESNVAFLIDTLILLTMRDNKKLVVDISEIEYIDSISVSMLIKEMTKIASIGGLIKLVVSEDKPRISFSIGNPISKIDVYLTLKTAIKDFIN